MARGGRRTGSPGKAYTNRSDLNQPIKVASGEPYGMRQQLEQAQHAIPLPNNAASPPAPSPPTGGGAAPVALPGAQDFARPTERPQEPVTAGLPIGAGPGPETLTSGVGPDLVGAQLRALYQQAPNNDLLRLIELHDRGF